MPILPDGDWPPSLGRQYTRLAMIERERELPGAELVDTMERDYIHGNIDNIVKRKKAIQLPEAFLPTEDGGQQLKILMDGAPGVGKSTMSRKVCKDWASGQLLQQYHLVILLPLRQASIREATSFESLIDADDPDLKQQVVRHIQRTSGEHVLLIVDGYDELSYKDRIQDSFFLDVVKGMKFSKCSVLVTSRPYASDYLQCLQSVNRHVEVLGFTEEQIENCILQNVPEKAKAIELVQTLKERQDIASLCYIPFNCAIVLYVYKMARWTLPHSLTKLYEIFILNSIKKHASITGNDSITVGLHTLVEIPESFQVHISALGKLAYDGLVADKMVFSAKDIKTAFPKCCYLDISNNFLSLLTVFKGFISTGAELSYQFLHLTIQEFLAARWAASQLSDGELLKFFQDHMQEERYRMMLLFLAGISQLSFLSAEDLFRAKLYLKHPNSRRISNRKVVDYFLFLAHLIYESQNFSLFHNLAGTIAGAELFAAWYRIAPFECLVLAHFLAWCNSSLKLLDLHGCGLTNQFLETMQKVNLQHHGTTQIKEVDLSNNPLTMLSLLSKLPVFAHTSVLKACNLQYPEGVSYDQIGLHHLLNMKKLTTLEVSVKEQNASGIRCFLSLKKFQFRNGNILSHNAVDIFRSLEHNTSLEELDLSWNSQLAEGDSEAVGCAIERMLNTNRTLKVLNLSGCNVTDPIFEHILSGLTKNTSLVTYDMVSNKLSGSCAVSLFQLMTTHPTLSINVSEVNIPGFGRVKMDRGTVWCVVCDLQLIPEKCVEFFRALNNSGLKISVLDLTDRTAEHFAVGLAESQSVQALKLEYCNITSAGAVSIFRSLEHNTSLEELDLSGNSQLAEGDSEAVGCAIERMLSVNRTLKVLNLTEFRFISEVESYFANGLAQNFSMRKVILHSNNIGSAGAVSIFRSLEHNTSLEELDLSGNWRLADGDCEVVGCAIERMLNVNKTLKVLNISGCNITDPIAKHILTGLTKNTSLVTLDMESSKLSGSCTVSLFQQMTTCPTLNIAVGEVNVLGVGRVKMDRGTMWCIMSETITKNCVEFFRALNDSGLKVSNLNLQHLTDQTAEHFAVELAESQSIRALKLKYCNITSAGAVSIFRSLEHNISLKLLGLSWNSQLAEDDSETVGCALERMLNVNKTLKRLNLNGCNITDPIVKHILTGLTKNTSLVTLNIESPTLSGSCAVSLLQQTTTHPTVSITVGEVNVMGVGRVKMKMDRGSLLCDIGYTIPENCVEFFRALNNSGLKVSILYVQHLTDQTAEHFAVGLAESQSVQALKLEHCNISSAGAVSIFRSLEHNTSLEELDLSENRQLAEVDGEAVGCAIDRMLNVNRGLEILNLSGCNVTDPIVKHILTGLTKNTSLLTLDMSSPTLSGSCAVSLFQQMTTHPTLSITVGEVNVLGVGRVEMDRGTVWCVIDDLIPEKCVEFFRVLNNSRLKISKLNVQDLTDLTAEHFAVGLAESQSVQTLKLEYCNISSTGAVSIFRSLEHNISLKKLHLSENSQLAEGDSEAVGCAIERMLNTNRTLKVLNLSGCNVTDPIFEHILTGLTKNTSLVTLDMVSNKLSGSCAVSLFQLMTTHPTLSINVNEVNVPGFGRVKMDRGTVWCVVCDLQLIPEKCVEFFRALNNSGLKISVLFVQDLTDRTAEHFAVGLAESQSVQALMLEHCNIRSAGAVNIFRSLEHNTSLKLLDLSRSWLLAYGDSEAVGCAIERMLNVNRTLIVLNLNECGLDSTVITHTAAGLAQNASLVQLNIRAGIFSITSEGWVHLFKALCSNTSLKKLDISRNKLEMEGSVALAGMLSCNKSLTELNLGWCDIPEGGLREIARGLLQNTSLKTLILRPTEQMTILEGEMERLKGSENFTSQSWSRLLINMAWRWYHGDH